MWDMCAGEALIQGMMGVVCDSDHKPLYYDEKALDFTIYNGIIVAKNRFVFDLINQRLIEDTGLDLPHF
jgi:3'-phosphoadenosine 5'-phosphosulfate (PAPS) 3'-phosphatase